MSRTKLIILVLAGAFLFTSTLASHFHLRYRRLTESYALLRSDLTDSLAAQHKLQQKIARARARQTGAPLDAHAHEAALQKKLERVYAEVVEKNRMITELRKAEEGVKKQDRPPRDRRNRGMDRLEELKKSDPERYKQIRERMQSFTRRMGTAIADQEAFLTKMDLAGMSSEQAENHDHVLELLQITRELTSKINEDPDGEDVPELRRELFTNMKALGGVLETEREMALQEMGRSLGYAEEEARQFSDYVKYVYDMTSMRSLWSRAKPPTRASQTAK